MKNQNLIEIELLLEEYYKNQEVLNELTNILSGYIEKLSNYEKLLASLENNKKIYDKEKIDGYDDTHYNLEVRIAEMIKHVADYSLMVDKITEEYAVLDNVINGLPEQEKDIINYKNKGHSLRKISELVHISHSTLSAKYEGILAKIVDMLEISVHQYKLFTKIGQKNTKTGQKSQINLQKTDNINQKTYKLMG